MENHNKNLLITGATSGIGESVAILAKKDNYNLTLLGRDFSKGITKSDLLKSESLVNYDLNDIENLKVIVDLVPVLDGIVFSAGVNKYVPFKYITKKLITELFTINFTSQVLLLKELLKKGKINNNSSIVFISSISSIIGSPGISIYSATKSALIGLVKTLAIEMAVNKIRVNAVSPGMVLTPMTEKTQNTLSKELIDEDMKKYPLGYGLPEDVANLVIFLLSTKSKWITGTNIVVDGGFTAL
ncbi:MAG: SDR family NAD(P)-dependent oxidoreductase [Ignavibacteriae bacterium]|nr:SDR family NAD(P)-dependent oxidoreductase [Ignavibacteriota bacterium]